MAVASDEATAIVKECQDTAEEQQQLDSAAPVARLAEPVLAEPAVSSAEPTAEPAAEESEPVDAAEDGASNAEPAAEATEADAPQEVAEPAAEQPSQPMGDVKPADNAAPIEHQKDLMKNLFDESSDDEAEAAAAEDAVDKRNKVEDLFGSDSSQEEEEQQAPTKKRKFKGKADMVQSYIESESSPQAKKAKSAGDQGGYGDNFIDDEGVPDHLRFDDETGPTHFQGDSDDDQDAGSDRDDVPEINTGRDELDQVMGVKQKKRKKTSDEVRRQAAERFIDRMHQAADADEHSMDHEEPAIAKVSLLEDLKMNLLKKGLQEFFLDHNCLLALNRHLERLPGTKERPNFTIRTTVLTLVSQLPIGTFHPEKSRGSGDTTIADEIHRMAKDKQEIKQNKALSWKLVENWFRLAVGSSTNQLDLARVDMEARSHAPRKAVEPENSGKTGIQMHQLAVRVPRKAFYDYLVRPQSSAEAKERSSKKISPKKGTTQKDKMK